MNIHICCTLMILPLSVPQKLLALEPQETHTKMVIVALFMMENTEGSSSAFPKGE